MFDLFAGGIAGRQIVGARHEGVNHAEVHAHVPHGLAAHGAGVVVARVLPKAVAVHEVATGQLLQHTSHSFSLSVRTQEKTTMPWLRCQQHVTCNFVDAQLTTATLAAGSSGMRLILQYQLSTRACKLPVLLKAYPRT